MPEPLVSVGVPPVSVEVPRVSVVVPTCRRPGRLERLLESLRDQSLAPERFEVIVVDDGGDAATAQLLRRWETRGDLALRWLGSGGPRGPAAARNRGWRSAQAPLIAFTDDDCVADPDWLSAALAVASRAPGSIVQGLTRPDPRETSSLGLLSRTVSVDTLGPQYETCNIFYPRSVLEVLGGFDERYGPGPAAEDTDLAWRAIEAGSSTVHAPDAVVLHAVQGIGPAGMLRVARRWEAAVRVFGRHPATRSALYHGVFWNVWHYLMWRSLLAMAAPAWLRRLLITRHLVSLRLRARESGAGMWAIPFLFVHDVVECWAVARGAVRYRTFVL